MASIPAGACFTRVYHRGGAFLRSGDLPPSLLLATLPLALGWNGRAGRHAAAGDHPGRAVAVYLAARHRDRVEVLWTGGGRWDWVRRWVLPQVHWF
jgi:hypothetical protein